MDKKLNEINYRSLSLMKSAWSQTVREVFMIPLWLFVVLLLIISVLLAFVLREYSIYFGIIIYAYLASKVVRQKAKIWKNFALDNGWQYFRLDQSDYSYIPPGLYGVGNNTRIYDVVNAVFEGHVCDVYMLQFTTGSGKNRQVHYYTIARVRLQRPFPHIILDSKKSRALQSRGHATDSVKLEGEFNDNFSLYFDKNDQVNALSVITPDVMQTLIASNTAQDIEIIDNNIFFMIHSDVRSAEYIPILFASVDALSDEIEHKSQTIQYQPIMTQQQRVLSQATGQYFKSGTKVMSSILITFAVFIFLPLIIGIIYGFMNQLFLFMGYN